MELYAVRYGDSILDAKYIYRDAPEAGRERITWSFYLARLPTTTVAIDVGFRDPQLASTWGVTLYDIEDELLKIADPHEVDRVFITHAHFDHIDNIDRFESASVVISSREYCQVLRDGSPSTRARLIRRDTVIVDDAERFDDTFEFRVIGGHTSGSAVVTFTAGSVGYVLTGDECYMADNLEHGRPIGVFANTQRNEAFIAAARTEGLVPLPCHDPGTFERYPAVSENIVRII